MIWEKMPDIIPASPAIRGSVIVLLLLLTAAICTVLYLNRKEKQMAAEQIRHIQEDIGRQYAYYTARMKTHEQAAIWRHDYNNHLRALQAMLADENTEQALRYARQLLAQCTQEKKAP